MARAVRGSTSVPGLAAEPTIDIDIVVAEGDVEAATAALVAIGYEPLGDLGIPNRYAFEPPPGSVRTNTHVVVDGCLSLRNHLAVRDVLRRDQALRDEYGSLKKSLGAALDNLDAYVSGKSEGLHRILAAGGIGTDERAQILGVNVAPTDDPSDRRRPDPSGVNR